MELRLQLDIIGGDLSIAQFVVSLICRADVPDEDLASVESLAFSRDGSQVAAAFYYGDIDIWNLNTAQCEQEIKYPQYGKCRNLAFSPRGTRIASGRRGEEIMIWNVLDGRLETTLNANPYMVDTISRSYYSWDESTILYIDEKYRWVSCGGERLLVLPSEFRTDTVTSQSSSLALAYEGSRMIIIDFESMPEM